MRKAQATCDNMFLLSQGSGDPILFLHGIPTSCQLWSGVIERMAGQFTCLAVDLPGLGRTARRNRGFGELSELVAAIDTIRIRNKIDRWHIVGHDAGCAIAVRYAHQHREHVSRLALLTPSIFPDLVPFFLFEMLRKPLLGEMIAPAVNLIFWKLVMRRVLDGDHTLDAVIEDFHAPFGGPLGAWRLMSLLRWGCPNEVLASIPALLPELRMPTLIMHGSKDPAVPQCFATRASQLIPNSEKILLNSGHFLPMSEPTLIANRLLGFLMGGSVSFSHQWTSAAVAADSRVTSVGQASIADLSTSLD
jgi:pimeloyl-ACP methyl ester carboxylesterase